MFHIAIRKIAISSFLSVLMASAPTYAQLVPQYWSVVASTGIPDEASASKVSFADTGSALFRSGASGTIQLRYPVIPSGELAKVKAGQSEGFFCLDVIYRDTGPGSRVVVRLKSTDGDGRVTTHLSFDSDSVRATGTAYVSNANVGDPVCGPRDADGSVMTSFRTDSRAYFIEAVLTKTTATANPGVRLIKILDSQLYD
jgi:hypothetical protein